MSPNNPSTDNDDAPPVLGSWPALYRVVLILHVILIILFYLFSRAYA